MQTAVPAADQSRKTAQTSMPNWLWRDIVLHEKVYGGALCHEVGSPGRATTSNQPP